MTLPKRSPHMAGIGGGACLGGQRNSTATGPLALVLSRLEQVRKAGKGYTAKCPAHVDRTASLSLAEGTDGRVLLHCFAGCQALDVVHAIGLQLADLYPERLSPLNPDHRRELREFARQANWKAALSMLALEAAVVLIAGRQLKGWGYLSQEDDDRLALAVDRVHDALAVLR